MRTFRSAAAALLSLPLLLAPLMAPGTAAAQAWPAKPIRLVVPYSPGGGVDTVARAVSQPLGDALGVAVLVDNRPGGNSVIGTEHVARSAPDGYTVLVTLVSHYAMPFLAKSVPYDPVRDFTPVTIIGKAPQALVANAAFPVASVRELIDYARRNPGKVSFGTAGAGTSQHLGGELLNVMAKLDMVHVPYKGGGPALNDLLGGQVPVAFLILSNVMPHIKAGKVRVLGVIESTRAKAAPDVPTVGETLPGFAVPDTWIGMMGPANLPPAVLDRLNAELAKAAEQPIVRSRLEAAGFEVNVVQSAEFARAAVPTTQAYRKMTADARIKPE